MLNEGLGSAVVVEDLNRRVIEQFAAAGKTRRYAAGDMIMRRGEPGDSMILLQKGRIEVSICTAHGSKSILGIYGPDTIIGDIACLDGRERSADVMALQPIEVLHISRVDVKRLLAEDKRTAQIVIEALCQKVRNATEVLELRALTTAKSRLANALLRLMDGEETGGRIRVSQSWLGNYSGLTRENVNRQLRAWSREGVARFENGEVVIEDPDRLLDVALSEGET